MVRPAERSDARAFISELGYRSYIARAARATPDEASGATRFVVIEKQLPMDSELVDPEKGENPTATLITGLGVVYPWQCDHMGHMNVMWYTGKFDEATWHLLAAIGLTPSYLRDRKRGMVAVQQETTYRRELVAGDLITIQSGILEMREKVIRFSHQMLNAETRELAATTTLTGVHTDSETRKSCPFPADILQRGRNLVPRTGS